MTFFVSYSTPDLHLVEQVAGTLGPHGQVFYWDESKLLGQSSWEQIFSWIDQSDFVFVLITGSTVTRAMAVGQEVGHAKAKGKTIIPLVSSDIQASELGFLGGITYQPIDPKNPAPALQSIDRTILRYKDKQSSDRGVLLLIIGAIVGLIFLSRE